MNATPDHIFYETAGNREYGLRFDVATGARKILIIPPLFDEMNRTRRMIVEAMRALAVQGVSSVLPDLPGCNESLAQMSQQSLTGWRNAVRDITRQIHVTHIAALRGGCLLDDEAGPPSLRLAPVAGATLLKTMLRTRIAADREAGISASMDVLRTQGARDNLDLAGYVVSPVMLNELDTASPVQGDHIHELPMSDIAGTPLWLRSEPGENAQMSSALALQWDSWSATCVR